MSIQLQSGPNEEGTAIFTVSLTDDKDQPVTPKAPVQWILTDRFKNEIASGTITAAESMKLVLSGSQLAVPNPDELDRYLGFSGTYDSDAGTDLPATEEVVFPINRFVSIGG